VGVRPNAHYTKRWEKGNKIDDIVPEHPQNQNQNCAPTPRASPPALWRCAQAFSLIELLVVIAIIAILAAVLFPVLAAAKARGQEAACLNNLREFAGAFLVYADDNGGKFVDNEPLGQMPSVSNNWTLGNMAIPTQCTNAGLLERGELFPYTTQVPLYHCPADVWQTNGAMHVRSYAMNSWVGSRSMETGIAAGYGMSGVTQEANYQTFKIENETAIMGASTLWIFADENEVNLNAPWWLVTMDDSQPFASFPALRHSLGYNLSFADGHAERWALRDTNTISAAAGLIDTYVPPITSRNSDWVRLKQASTRRLGPALQ